MLRNDTYAVYLPQIRPFTSIYPKWTLYRVPWLELPTSERREVVADESTGGDSGSTAEIQERLQALVYK
jgi:hypothetical protein